MIIGMDFVDLVDNGKGLGWNHEWSGCHWKVLSAGVT